MIWTEEQTAQIASLYMTHSRAEIAAIMGLSPGQVRAKLMRLGLNTKRDAYWSEDEIMMLRAAYERSQYSEEIDLDGISKLLKRHKTNVSRKARELGLTNKSRPSKKNKKNRVPKFNSPEQRREHRSATRKEWLKSHPHPKGMLGKKHSEETRERLSASSKKMMSDLSAEQKAAMIMKGLKKKRENGTLVPPRKSNWKSGWYEIGGRRIYMRSSWEYNYAGILEKRKSLGIIKEWEYEADTFWFEKIKSGTRCYTPDFKITNPDGSIEYHEIKGWLDPASKTKLKRMKKYHPNVSITLIQEKAYKSILKRGI